MAQVPPPNVYKPNNITFTF